MAIRNAKVSEAIWYGLATGLVFFGLNLYRPKYYYTFAKVEHI